MNQRDFDRVIDKLCIDHNENLQALTALFSVSKSSEIRDFNWKVLHDDNSADKDIYDAMWISLNRYWLKISLDVDCFEEESIMLSVWYYISTLPEFDHVSAAANPLLTFDFTKAATRRIAILTTHPQTAKYWRRTLEQLKHLVHWLYSHCVPLRAALRSQIGHQLLAVHHYKGSTIRSGSKFSVQGSDAGSSRAHVSHFLDILCAIVSGLSFESTDGEGGTSSLLQFRSVSELLSDVLMPLHAPNEMVEWRDQIPVLQSYHEGLVRCLLRLVERDRLCAERHLQARGGTHKSILAAPVNVLTQALKTLLRTWPDGYQSNTPKQVLLLHELEMLLEMASLHEVAAVQQALLTRLVKCIGSEADNIRPAQRALQFFKSDKILQLVTGSTSADVTDDEANAVLRAQVADRCLSALLPALYREGRPSWNPTVNKMTALALRNIRDRNEPLFRKHCLAMFPPLSGGEGLEQQRIPDDSLSEEKSTGETTKRLKPSNPARPVVLREQLPPVSAHSTGAEEGSSRRLAPMHAMLPPRVVGISSRPPVAASGALRTSVGSVQPMQYQQFSASNPPPVTITGVAPWAVKAAPVSGTDSSSASGSLAATTMPGSRGALSVIRQQHREEKNRLVVAAAEEEVVDGYVRLLAYMELCYPAAQAAEHNALHVNEWSAQQAAVSPTLLPSLKFHDLVFGRLLGEGAFSSVKYARQITRDKTQSAWPEFAVKVVSSAKIAEHRYLSSVVREMAALQMLSHPGVARLVSTFRYRDSAYLVLEYAAKGDLHSYLIDYGKLGHLQTRFVVGEVAAALLSIHDLGLCFNDLKPENILITEIGHVKLADFGACRPVTQEARDLLQRSKSVLSNIRNGDWRDPPVDSSKEASGTLEVEQHQGEDENEDDLFLDDDRVEGTPAYLPPEVLRGRASLLSTNADAWALGCVAHFCLQGRPLYFGDKEEVLEQILLRADASSSAGHKVHFQEEHTSSSSSCESGDCLRESEDCAARAFVDGLTCVDLSHRLTTLAASNHFYLTVGLSPQVDVASSGSNLPPLLSPLALHSGPPIALPTNKKRVGSRGEEGGIAGSGQEELWARRQFSRLWAPMPSEYALDGEEATDAVKPLSADSSASEVWLQSHPHRLTPIEEQQQERDSSFLVFRPQRVSEGVSADV